MTPEQVKRQKLDGCSDPFSFGAVAYELSSGLVRLKEDNMLDGIRSDARFANLQRRVGLRQ